MQSLSQLQANDAGAENRHRLRQVFQFKQIITSQCCNARMCPLL